MEEQQEELYLSPETVEVLILALRVDAATPETGARPPTGLRSVKQIVYGLISSPERK